MARMQIWFVDDRLENHDTWLASFPDDVQAACTLRTFESVPALFQVLDAGERPDVLFVDFFLRGHTGEEVLDRVLHDGGAVPLLIAHSSLDRANVAMVHLGAHLALAKHKGRRRTQSIVEAAPDLVALHALRDAHLGA